MAPAACDTIIQNLEDFERKEQITTGSLPEILAMWGRVFYSTL